MHFCTYLPPPPPPQPEGGGVGSLQPLYSSRISRIPLYFLHDLNNRHLQASSPSLGTVHVIPAYFLYNIVLSYQNSSFQYNPNHTIGGPGGHRGATIYIHSIYIYTHLSKFVLVSIFVYIFVRIYILYSYIYICIYAYVNIVIHLSISSFIFTIYEVISFFIVIISYKYMCVNTCICLCTC